MPNVNLLLIKVEQFQVEWHGMTPMGGPVQVCSDEVKSHTIYRQSATEASA